jgi:RNA polymerase sigma factor (sigma-70 family)
MRKPGQIPPHVRPTPGAGRRFRRWVWSQAASSAEYRAELGAPTTWLYGIAAHKLNDWRRRGYAEDRARRRLGIERPRLSELSRLADEVTVVELLEELPPDQRPALRARLLDDRAYGEIALAEGVPEAAIRQRVSRGLASLRTRLGGDR